MQAGGMCMIILAFHILGEQGDERARKNSPHFCRLLVKGRRDLMALPEGVF